ncbi:MAG: MBL fold metallo-hydrolase [Eubacterium pyruvativorans]|uniref:MBL fold metallo-hydrolase n=1 Tax=Eubacterium pyruvativorans TaxID=155865 RepID=UPI002A7F654B|nr:MBL fold metallo-hydrolase [Eubacterium pyruvativorans]MDY4049407.1 MBL fold metallo-hydrolase [Eubacterium pyruvativorans]
MANVRIQYFGHACFKVSTEKGSAVFDPYEDGSVPGTTLPRNMEADAVFCSHDHHDHNGTERVKLTGRSCPFDVSFLTVPHDDANGEKRGFCRFTFLEAGGITVAHLGDLGRLPEENEYEKLSQADVLLMPCAGYYTIDAGQTKEMLGKLKKPSLKILMHYREGERGYDVQKSISEVMEIIPEVHRMQETEITVDARDVPDQVITLRPLQAE